MRGQRHAPPAPYPRERPGTHCTGGWVVFRAGLDWCGKSRPTGIRSPDRPARRQSLYRLRYPAHITVFLIQISVSCAFAAHSTGHIPCKQLIRVLSNHILTPGRLQFVVNITLIRALLIVSQTLSAVSCQCLQLHSL